MNEKELELLMDYLLELTRFKLVLSYNNKGELVTRLKFPNDNSNSDNSNSTRVSEQEMRFAFVEAFNETCPKLKEKLYYAVEVPTCDRYKFNDGAPKAGVGRCGNIDVVIYDEKGPRILIEFKGNNPSKKSYEKDFCKLDNEKEYKAQHFTALRYFIEILKSADEGTKVNLSEKCKDHPGIHFAFLDLNSGNYLTDIKL